MKPSGGYVVGAYLGASLLSPNGKYFYKAISLPYIKITYCSSGCEVDWANLSMLVTTSHCSRHYSSTQFVFYYHQMVKKNEFILHKQIYMDYHANPNVKHSANKILISKQYKEGYGVEG